MRHWLLCVELCIENNYVPMNNTVVFRFTTCQLEFRRANDNTTWFRRSAQQKHTPRLRTSQPCFLEIFLPLQIDCQYTISIWVLVTRMTRSDDSYVIRRYQSRNGKQITFAPKVQSAARNFHSLWLYHLDSETKWIARNIVDDMTSNRCFNSFKDA